MNDIQLYKKINSLEQGIHMSYTLGRNPSTYILNRYDKLVEEYNKLKPNNKLYTLGNKIDIKV